VLEIGHFYKLYIKDNILSFGNLETILSAIAFAQEESL
jgi:hypothetical protein